MQIDQATITVADVAMAVAYYADALGLPVASTGDEARVTLGASTLVLRAGAAFGGDHHLAFGIAPEDFEVTLAFAREHLSTVVVEGSDVIDGPPGWDSRSVYFRGPEGIVLEYIAREAHRGRDQPGAAGPPRVRCLSEIGLGVADVPATVTRLGKELGLPPFPPQSTDFAPVGDHDGLLILVDQDRTWFPTRDATAACGPLTVTLGGAGTPGARLEVDPTSTLRSR